VCVVSCACLGLILLVAELVQLLFSRTGDGEGLVGVCSLDCIAALVLRDPWSKTSFRVSPSEFKEAVPVRGERCNRVTCHLSLAGL
jgi:hypothetical protein